MTTDLEADWHEHIEEPDLEDLYDPDSVETAPTPTAMDKTLETVRLLQHTAHLVEPRFLPHHGGLDPSRMPSPIDERNMAVATKFGKPKEADLGAWLDQADQVTSEAVGHEVRSTWLPEDISDVLDGNRPAVITELGIRSDGVYILYRGKEHSIAGEPESGKTWFALMIVAQELKRGRRVAYVDFEDDAGTVVGRLLALGVLKERLRAPAGQFKYIRPETKPNATDIGDAVMFGEVPADVVVYDGITEGATLLGLDVTGGDGQHAVAEFRSKLIRPALSAGSAVLTTDHVVKSRESRGRYAIGAQHKLAGLTGAMFLVEVVDTWGRGRRGRSRILVSKDRNGHLRANALPTKEPNLSYFGDLVGNAENEEGLIDVNFYAPSERDEMEGGDEGQPAEKYRKFVDPILKAIDASPGPVSTNGVVGSVTGNKSDITTTLAWLIEHGHVVREQHGRGFGHRRASTDVTGSGPGPTESGTQ